ncbi:MAG: B12-binding domain-containing radical SAM protein [Planctomycetota bacterium]|jgi:radical SAM superfamily enzyme YgiQ (UPF0313 family)
MRIALINPVARRCQGYHTIGSKIPPLGLQVLAHLTPSPHTVEIIDEIFGFEATAREIRRGRFDLVGVTSYSSGATRAYEIAEKCRSEGIPTIMGGPHAWAVPEEVGRYFDSVAVGECDEIWPEIVEDASRGQIQPRYTGRLTCLDKPGMGKGAQQLQPINGTYDVASLQTSRGCPVGCDYCSVTLFNGAAIRRRDIGEIIDEWNETPKRFIFVTDDNFFGVGAKHAEWSKELLGQIIKHGKKKLWFSQTTVNMGDDEEGLRLAYKAGCRGMLVGFESFNSESLKDYHKGINRNVDDYKRQVDGFHRAGIPVFGAFIIGADQDTDETVAETAVQAVKLGIDTIQITNLTPLPGTKLYDRWMSEGKIFATNYPEDWERYTFVETVYKPKSISANKLDETIYELRHAAARTSWVWRRTLRTLWQTRSLTSALFIHGMNKGWKRMAKEQLPRDEERFGFVPRKNSRTRKLRDAFKLSLGKYGSFVSSQPSSATIP